MHKKWEKLEERDMTNKKVLAVLALLFLALFASGSGCTEKTPSVEEIKEEIRQKETNIEDYSFTIRLDLNIDGETLEQEFDIMSKEDMYRIVTKKPGEDAEKVEVSDGEYMWTYYPWANTATKMKLPEKVETEENGSEENLDGGLIEGILNSGNVSVLGTEEIRGRTAYLLEIRPEEERDEEEKTEPEFTKIWIDKETGILLGYEYYTEDMKGKMECLNLKVNTGISDSEFGLEVPEGTEVKTREFGKDYPPENLTPPGGEKAVATAFIFGF